MNFPRVLPMRLLSFLDTPIYLEWYDMSGWEFEEYAGLRQQVTKLQWLKDRNDKLYLMVHLDYYSFTMTKEELIQKLVPADRDYKYKWSDPRHYVLSHWKKFKFWWECYWS